MVGKTGLGKNLTPAGARWEKLVLVLVPSERSGKERTAGVAGSSASSPQVSRDGNKDQFLFWNETQLFVLLQPAGGSGSLDTSAST